MLGRKKKVDDRPFHEQYLEDGKQIWDAEKEKQLSKREVKKQKEYEKLLKTMNAEDAHALQDKREAKEILEHMQKRSKKAIKKAARKRMGMRGRVKSVVAGAILGGAGYLGLSSVVHTEDREIIRALNASEYKNEVAKNYLTDGYGAEHHSTWDKNLVDWDSPDWYDQWINAMAMQKYKPLSEDLKDLGAVDAILNGDEFSFIYRDYLMQAPNGYLDPLNVRYSMVGTEQERLEMYSYAFEQKWGMDPTTMDMNDDALAAHNWYLNPTKLDEFIKDLAIYRSMTFESSEYRNDFEAISYVGWDNYYEYEEYDTYAEYLDAKEQELFETSYAVNDVVGYNGLGDFVMQMSLGMNNNIGDSALAKEVWKEYMSIQQARVMCAEDALYFATPSELLPMFGITEADPMFQKYAELGGDEAIVARLLMIEHPGCNTFHSDGSIHMTDAGTLTGEALTKFNEDLAFYQDLLSKGDNLTALEYANMLYTLDPDLRRDVTVDIVNSVTEVVPGDDPVTHIGLPVTLLFAMGYMGMQRRNLRKAVNAEIESDIVKAKVKMEQERVKEKTTRLLLKRWCGEGDNTRWIYGGLDAIKSSNTNNNCTSKKVEGETLPTQNTPEQQENGLAK